MRLKLRHSLRTAEFKDDQWVDPGTNEGRPDGDFIDWLTIHNPGRQVADVRHIRLHQLVPQDIPIYGYVYDVRTGRFREVAKAIKAGHSWAGRPRRCGSV